MRNAVFWNVRLCGSCTTLGVCLEGGRWTYPTTALSAANPTYLNPASNPGGLGGMSAGNNLSYATAERQD
jgi:hypothetical protein